MAISADQSEGKRMQRRAKAATRKAMNMTNMGEGEEGGTPEWGVVVGRGKETGEKRGRKCGSFALCTLQCSAVLALFWREQQIM